MSRALPDGFVRASRLYHARMRKARRAARAGINKATAGLNAAQRNAVTSAYHAYLAGRAAHGADYRPMDHRPLPAAVQGPSAVDWSDYDAIADYS